jgi:hypothetical protein
MSARNIRQRTIGMPESRSRQIANAAAYLNVTGEEFIQSAITAALLSLAGADKVFAHILARSAGVDWAELVSDHSDVLEKIA